MLSADEEQSLRLMAVDLEREAFYAGDPREFSLSLVRKSDCLAALSDFDAALEALSRVRMYALEPEDVRTVVLRRELYAIMAGRHEEALGAMRELEDTCSTRLILDAMVLAREGSFEEAKAKALAYAGNDAALLGAVTDAFSDLPKMKKDGLAAFLSFIPPLGHIYACQPGRGTLMTLADAGEIAFGVWQIISHNYITGYLCACVPLSKTWFEEAGRVQQAAANCNEAAINDFLSRRIFTEAIQKAFSETHTYEKCF